MNEQNDLKSQVSALRDLLMKIEADKELTISQKTNKIVKVSRDIRKLYKLNQLETDKKIKDAISNKGQIQKPIEHVSLDYTSENQNGLKLQVAVLNRLHVCPEIPKPPKNLEDGRDIYYGVFENIMNNEPITENLKRVLKISDEVLFLYDLNIKESKKRMEVSRLNMKLGFKPGKPLYFEDLDEEPF